MKYTDTTSTEGFAAFARPASNAWGVLSRPRRA